MEQAFSRAVYFGGSGSLSEPATGGTAPPPPRRVGVGVGETKNLGFMGLSGVQVHEKSRYLHEKSRFLHEKSRFFVYAVGPLIGKGTGTPRGGVWRRVLAIFTPSGPPFTGPNPSKLAIGH